MKREYSILLALPATNALSLANFQSISLTTIPILCQVTYDGQIPSCQVSDFKTGCTPACLEGLDSICADVIDACAGTHVTSNSLLGIIQDGGIRGALCPTLATTTTKSVKTKTTSTAVESITLPTDSVGVTGGLGLQTSTTTTIDSTMAASTSKITTKQPAPTVESTTSESATSAESTTADATSSTETESAATKPTPTTITTTVPASIQTSESSNSIKATATPKATANADSGGGSPFDIQSGATRIGDITSLGFLVLAAWAGMLVTR